MFTPEFSQPGILDVNESEHSYYTVQHQLADGDGWEREIPPVASAQQAIAAFRAHAHWYEPGHIRAVRKVIRTTVETCTTELITSATNE